MCRIELQKRQTQLTEIHRMTQTQKEIGVC